MRILHCIYSKKPQFGTDDRIEKYTLNSNGVRTAVYSNLDNSADSGTSYTVNEVVSEGIDRLYTDTVDSLGRVLQRNHDYNADGVVDMVEYYEIDPDTGNTVGVYYNRDNDYKDGVALSEKTGQTITLNDGRVIHGIDNYTLRTFDDNNKIIGESFNLDASGAIDRQYYYVVDVYGNRLAEYQNLDNDTTLTLTGESQVTGQTITLADGREVQGIERFYLYERNANGQLIKTENNLDGQGQIESVVYYERDAYGREIAVYENSNNDLSSSGAANPTGYEYTLSDGRTIQGIDKVTAYERNVYGSATQTKENLTGEVGEDKFTRITTRTFDERNREVSNETVVKTAEGDQVSARNEYTYNVYGNQATRSIDSNTAVEGFETIATYTYDVYRQLIRTDNRLPNDETIQSYATNERDIYGRIIETETYANNTLSSRNESVYDQYNRVVKSIPYAGNAETPTQIITTTFDAYGRSSRIEYDKNANGVLDKGDIIYEYTRDPATGRELTNKVTTYVKNGTTVNIQSYQYDDFGRRSLSLRDENENGTIDVGEVNSRYTYIGNSSLIDTVNTYNGDNFTSSYKMIYNEANQILGGQFINTVREISWISYDGYGSPRDSVQDYTTSTSLQKLFTEQTKPLGEIHLTNTTAKTDITLDNDVIALMRSNIAGKITINGDSGDSVRLKDFSEFVSEGKVTENSQTYDKFTTTVDTKTYTLLVDEDINLYNADTNTLI